MFSFTADRNFLNNLHVLLYSALRYQSPRVRFVTPSTVEGTTCLRLTLAVKLRSSVVLRSVSGTETECTCTMACDEVLHMTPSLHHHLLRARTQKPPRHHHRHKHQQNFHQTHQSHCDQHSLHRRRLKRPSTWQQP